MNRHRSSKITFNLSSGKEFFDQLGKNEDKESADDMNEDSKTRTKTFNMEEMKDETRKLFIKLEEKTYLDSTEHKREITKQIKEMTDYVKNFQNSITELRTDIDKINIRKDGCLGDALDKIGKLETELNSLKMKQNNGDKRVSDFIDRMEKIVDENLLLTGLVGEYNKFKDLKSILEYLLSSYQNSVISKEKSNLEYANFKEKLESKVNSLINKFELQEKSIKAQVYSRIDLCESNLRTSIEDCNDKINEVRLENTKAAVRLISASEILEKEVKESQLQRVELANKLERRTEATVNDIKGYSKDLSSHFDRNVNDLKLLLQKQVLAESEHLSKMMKNDSDIILINDKIDSLAERVEQKIEDLKSSGLAQPYNYFFSSLNLSTEGFYMSILGNDEEEVDNQQQNEFDIPPEKKPKKVVFNTSSKNVIKFQTEIPQKQIELEEKRSKTQSARISSESKPNSILPKINISNRSNYNKNNYNLTEGDSAEGLPSSNLEGNFKVKVTQNFQRSEFLIQDTRQKLKDILGKLNFLMKSSNPQDTYFETRADEKKKLNTTNYKFKVNNGGYQQVDLASQAFPSKEKDDKFKNENKLPSKSTTNLNFVHKDSSFNVKAKASNSSSNILLEQISKDTFIPSQTESNLCFTNSHLKKKLHIVGSGPSIKFKTQGEIVGSSIGNSVRMKELENDENLIENNYAVKFLNPSSCNVSKSTQILKSSAKPKDITGFMRFNIIDLKK